MSADPFRAYNFHLIVEGLTLGRFIEASGLGVSTEVIAYREGGAGAGVRHLAGQVNYSPLVLQYGVSNDSALWDWFKQTTSGNVERRNVSLLQYENDGVTESFRWNLFEAWPAKFLMAPLDGTTSNVAIESVTIVFDRVERD